MEKTFGQRIVHAIAIICYLAALACVAGAILYQPTTEHDAIRASLIATVVFFLGCGVVLHVIATTRLKGLISGRSSEADAQATINVKN